MDNKNMAIIGVLAVVAVILCVVFAFGILGQNSETLEIDDISIKQDQFGIYNLAGHITPERDYAYMEARIVFYDENGTIIGKAPCAWNMRDLQKGSEISVGNGLGAVVDGTPAYAVVSFYDDVRSTDALANYTVEFDGSTNKSSDTNASSSVTVSSNNDNSNANNNDDKKYTQEDMDKARQESYREGYDNSHDDSYQSGDSSNVETTTDNGQNRGYDSGSVETSVVSGSLE